MSKSSARKRVVFPALRKVDREIIQIIATNRFANHKDLERSLKDLSPGYNLFRRTRHLRNIGLIESLIGDGGMRLGFRLTRKGIEFAKAVLFINGNVLQSRPTFKTQFDHDQIVNEAREILSASPIISNFVSEIELRSAIGKDWRNTKNKSERDWKVPDALFSLRTAKGVMTTALEVELTQKAKTRYSKIIQALLTSRKFHLVFVLCKNEKLLTIIRNEVHAARVSNALVRASNRSNGIYFCTLDKLRNLRIDAPWEGEESRFSISEISSNLSKEPEQRGKP